MGQFDNPRVIFLLFSSPLSRSSSPKYHPISRTVGFIKHISTEGNSQTTLTKPRNKLFSVTPARSEKSLLFPALAQILQHTMSDPIYDGVYPDSPNDPPPAPQSAPTQPLPPTPQFSTRSRRVRYPQFVIVPRGFMNGMMMKPSRRRGNNKNHYYHNNNTNPSSFHNPPPSYYQFNKHGPGEIPSILNPNPIPHDGYVPSNAQDLECAISSPISPTHPLYPSLQQPGGVAGIFIPYGQNGTSDEYKLVIKLGSWNPTQPLYDEFGYPLPPTEQSSPLPIPPPNTASSMLSTNPPQPTPLVPLAPVLPRPLQLDRIKPTTVISNSTQSQNGSSISGQQSSNSGMIDPTISGEMGVRSNGNINYNDNTNSYYNNGNNTNRNNNNRNGSAYSIHHPLPNYPYHPHPQHQSLYPGQIQQQPGVVTDYTQFQSYQPFPHHQPPPPPPPPLFKPPFPSQPFPSNVPSRVKMFRFLLGPNPTPSRMVYRLTKARWRGKKIKKCPHKTKCTNRNCQYFHPPDSKRGWIDEPCPFGLGCNYQTTTCQYLIHDDDKKTSCAFKSKCCDRSCPYHEPNDVRGWITTEPCPFGSKCAFITTTCKYLTHSNAQLTTCPFGPKCTDRDCSFHPDTLMPRGWIDDHCPHGQTCLFKATTCQFLLHVDNGQCPRKDGCRHRQCPLDHPNAHPRFINQPCIEGSKCAFKDTTCKYEIHEDGICLVGDTCTHRLCAHQHPNGRGFEETPCQYGLKCNRRLTTCKYLIHDKIESKTTMGKGNKKKTTSAKSTTTTTTTKHSTTMCFFDERCSNPSCTRQHSSKERSLIDAQCPHGIKCRQGEAGKCRYLRHGTEIRVVLNHNDDQQTSTDD